MCLKNRVINIWGLCLTVWWFQQSKEDADKSVRSVLWRTTQQLDFFFFFKCNIILQYRSAEEGCVLISARQNSVSLGHLSLSSIFLLCSLKDEALLQGIEILHLHCYSRSLWSLSLSSFEVFCRLYQNNKKFVLFLGVWTIIILLNCCVLSSLCTRQSGDCLPIRIIYVYVCIVMPYLCRDVWLDEKGKVSARIFVL